MSSQEFAIQWHHRMVAEHAKRLKNQGWFEMANPELAKERAQELTQFLGEEVFIVDGVGRWGVCQFLFVRSGIGAVHQMIQDQLQKARETYDRVVGAYAQFIELDISPKGKPDD